MLAASAGSKEGELASAVSSVYLSVISVSVCPAGLHEVNISTLSMSMRCLLSVADLHSWVADTVMGDGINARCVQVAIQIFILSERLYHRQG